MTSAEPVAVVGIGCRFPGAANTPSALWELLKAPGDLSIPIPGSRFNARGFYHEDGQYHGHANVNKSYFLSDDDMHRRFDAQFFGISPAEARCLDPQVRLLLETVYEALEQAGCSIDTLRGSDTAVYSGVMVHDYEHIMSRDENSMGTYHVTGTASSLISNRISYFFDWHGPSMTIDTACSSSLYAVHHAVQQLRSGASRTAVATGCNLLLDPIGYVTESKMQMLSPTGHSRMWDIDADGYARGEGIAAVVLKTLSAAEADGDHIHCIIRETAVNQDGRTKGITVPSSVAQASMIRDCYSRAGLDLTKAADRPQYFEAHGTGTPAGDPIEAEAIQSALFPLLDTQVTTPLYVGSVKTVIGHTEGTAGLAGLLKAALAIQNSQIPPNLHFNRLSPRVSPFYSGLQIPTCKERWPCVPLGTPRRASVNSFGFGGANAHCILEHYERQPERLMKAEVLPITPVIFSAMSESSLRDYLDKFRNFMSLQENDINLQDLAFTLNSRRTRFPCAAAFSASTTAELVQKITRDLHSVASDASRTIGTRASVRSDRAGPSILGIFTGQGAQWPRMGAELVEHSAAARAVIEKLDAQLAKLPPVDRPHWSILEELQKDDLSSCINGAAFSQPLCTAVQILLVDVLKAAGITFHAVVGHSSGEIAAAYAAGRISAEHAICIAYYRGLSVVAADRPYAKSGSMMAVGTSQEDAEELLQEPEYEGRAWLAAVNSLASVTLSGDSDAIRELQIVFQDEKKFARVLKVDRAYHSPHMLPASALYSASQKQLDFSIQPSSECSWISSVHGTDNILMRGELNGQYWNSNLLQPVLFKQSVETAWREKGPFDMAVEVGPHAALKGPLMETVHHLTGQSIPYTNLLQRGVSALYSIADALGSTCVHLGRSSVDLSGVQNYLSGNSDFQVLSNLPPYSWNHENEYWHESRHARAHTQRTDCTHDLLGHLSPDCSDQNMQWRHLIRPREIPWLKGHQLQGQIVFPAAGYVVTALEACLGLVKEQPAEFIEILNVQIDQALTFDDENTGVETLFSLANIVRQSRSITADFTYSAAIGKHETKLDSLAHGSVFISLGQPSDTILPSSSSCPTNMIPVKSEEFYDSLARLEYEYSGPFVALSGLKRKLGAVAGNVTNVEESSLVIHPALLDAAFQAVILAASAPDDGRLWAMHVPNKIQRIRVNPSLCANHRGRGELLRLESNGPASTLSLKGDVAVFPTESSYAMVQVEGLECVPFSPATAEDDRVMFSATTWGPAFPDAKNAAFDGLATAEQQSLALSLERVAIFYLRRLEREITPTHPCRTSGVFTSLFNFSSHILNNTEDGHVSMRPGWTDDTMETMEQMRISSLHSADANLLHAIGSKLPEIVTNETSAIEVGMRDDNLTNFYLHGLGMPQYLQYLARTLGQILHRSPRIHALEIGAGTGAATNVVRRETNLPFSTYTFTDISSGFFESAQTKFASHLDTMIFKVLDISKDPLLQGYELHSYDLIVASMVLHATPSLKETLLNVRRLLKPGGYLVVLEVQADAPARIGTMFGAFPGWWLGSDDGRVLSPCASIQEWDTVLRQTGFSGCDTTTPDPDPLVQPFTLFVSQALDDRVQFLRSPFTPAQKTNAKTLMSDLIILTDDTRHAALASQLQTLLQPYVERTTTTCDVENIQFYKVNSGTTIVSLLELEKSVFQDLSSATWESLKATLQEAACVLWVSHGRRAQTPHSNMIVGLLRSALDELASLEIQFLDIEDPSKLTANVIGESLLRFNAAIEWTRKEKYGGISLTIEPELIIEKGGRVVVPRLKACDAMNDRYNSSRRTITTKRPYGEFKVTIDPANSGYRLRSSPFETLASCTQSLLPKVKVSHSLLWPVRLAGRGRLFLSVGHNDDTLESVIALSTTNSSIVSPKHLIPIGSHLAESTAALFLELALFHHITSQILEDLEEGDNVLVLEADIGLLGTLKEEARNRGVSIISTTTRNDLPDDFIRIHPNASDRDLQHLNLSAIAVFLDLATGDESSRVAARISRYLPGFCKQETNQTLFGGPAQAVSKSRSRQIESEMQMIVALTSTQLHSTTGNPTRQVPLKDVQEIDPRLIHQAVVSWTGDHQVPIGVRPVDDQPMLSQEKTYWLVGLSGTLGLSLCEWMIRHNARYVVISSRNPNVSQGWLEEMTAIGGVVQVMPCDVTKIEQLIAVYSEICNTMPPLAGVAHGAMVLNDTRFRDLSFDILQQVGRAKIEGSINLESLLHNADLDFFIFFSSASSVIGTPGQAPYSAANMFMVSLAEQRRQRGLAACVINIGPVYGVGYLAERRLDISSMLLLGVRPISEQDFQQLFAEAVLSCRSRQSDIVDITTGVEPVRLDDDARRPKWVSNPIFSHLVQSRRALAHVASTKSKASLKARLHDTQNIDEVDEIVKSALIEKLGSSLQLDVKASEDGTIDQIGFDELGVDSLMATEIRSWLIKSFQVNIPVLKILGGMSIGELVAMTVESLDATLIPNVRASVSISTSISSTASESLPDTEFSLQNDASQDEPSSPTSDAESKNETASGTVLHDAVSATADLSLTQSMFWLASQMFDNNASLNVTGVAKITGAVRVSELKRAVHALGENHECFRTCFTVSDGRVTQQILKSSSLYLETRSMSSAEDIDLAQREVRNHVYDLVSGKTARAVLLSESPTTHYLIVGTTHLCFDGYSVQVLLKDLFQHYAGITPAKSAPKYRDYIQLEAMALASGRLSHDLQYWKQVYTDFPPVLPILRVSSVTSRASLASFDHVRSAIRIQPRTRSLIQQACRRTRVTPFHFFLACFRALISRYSEAEDLAIGVGDAHRNETGAEDCIGVFVNVLPVRFHTKLVDSFYELARDTKNVVHQALENSSIPYQAVLNELDPPRSGTFTPIFQSFINYRQVMGKSTLSDLDLELVSIEPSRTGYDLNLDIIDDPSDCRITLFARKDLYQEQETGVLMASFQRLVEHFSEHLEATIAEPDIYEPSQVQKAYEFGQGSVCDSKWPPTVIHRFDEIAAMYPERLAVLQDIGGVTYSELLRLSGSIATALIARGATVGSRVALLQEPSPHWIASILAVMRIGAVYLPLDLSSPLTRLAAIVKDCGPRFVLVDKESKQHVQQLGQPDISVIDACSVKTNGPPPPVAAITEGEAILLYTSGSTGAPKGIMLKHICIQNQIEPEKEIYSIGAEVVLQQSASGFDLSYIQIFTSLCFGGSLYPLPRHLRGDALAISELISAKGITYTLATPTECSSWLRYGRSDLLCNSSWRAAVCAGEAISGALLKQFRDLKKPDLRVHNSYGPTELGVVASTEVDYAHVEEAATSHNVAAGVTLPNCSLLVLDEQLRIVPPGVQGEIYLGGANVASGYVNNARLTAERFVSDPFASDEFRSRGWTVMHRVGDLGRWAQDGSIMIEGRVSGDTQIKLRGLRIDVQEIEEALLAAAGGSLSEAVVTTRKTSPITPQFLVAHVVFHHSCTEQGRQELLQDLSSSLPLPRYMRPTLLVPIDQMPRTSSAKLDRRLIGSLPVVEVNLGSRGISPAGLSDVEKALWNIWMEILQQQIVAEQEITKDSDFFVAGGTSLLLLELQARVRAKFGIKLSVVRLMEFSSLGAMASLVDESHVHVAKAVDWEKETAIPAEIAQLQDMVQVIPQASGIVVFTGSTGYLGQGVLDELLRDPLVVKVHCIGIRAVHTRDTMRGLEKVQLWEGDLKRPRLGLSEKDAHMIFSEADRIIHNGAEVSHLQTYHSLRLANTQSTMEIVKMSLQAGRRIPLHFVSTAQVGVYFAENTGRLALPEISVSAHPPPTDGSEGYAAGKWASECYLERLNEETRHGWPVFVHRPSLISRPPDAPASDLVHNVRHFAAKIRAVPKLTHMHGWLNTVALADVVSGIVGSLHGPDAASTGVRYKHYFGEERLPVDDPATALFGPENGIKRTEGAPIEELSPEEWTRRAVESGLPEGIAQWMDSAKTQRVQYFPELLHGGES